MWTDKRKRIVYERQKSKGVVDIAEHGEADGIFWMSLNDFTNNFATIFLCSFFDDSWEEQYYCSEWSAAKNTAGGCTNYPSVGQNPQVVISTQPTNDAVEAFILLQVRVKPG